LLLLVLMSWLKLCSMRQPQGRRSNSLSERNLNVTDVLWGMKWEWGTVVGINIKNRSLSIVVWRKIDILLCQFQNTKLQNIYIYIFVCLRSDCKMADNYLIGYNHVWWGLCESGWFRVLYCVRISKLFKLLFLYVHFWLFWMKCLEILETELV